MGGRQEILIAKKIIGPTGTFLLVLRGAEGQLTEVGLCNISVWPLFSEYMARFCGHDLQSCRHKLGILSK
jgi:hypothetical protein